MPVPHAALGDDVIGKMLHVAHVTFNTAISRQSS